MEPLLRRTTHQQLIQSHMQETSSQFKNYLLYFLASYLLLILIAFLYLRNQASSKYTIPVLPYDEERFFLELTIIVIMGALAFSATLAESWTQHIWTLYAVSNLLQAAFIYVYHSSIAYSLVLSTLLMAGMGASSYYLFKEMAEGISGVTMLCLIGIVQAWALVWLLVVMGQVLVSELGLEKRTQTIVFFVLGVMLLTVVAYWHRREGVGWLSLIGYIFCGAALLSFMFFRCYHHSLW